jgi:SAM-dependent methyltransferase
VSRESEVESEMKQRSRSFDAWADEYDRYRPTYPELLFDLIATRLALPDKVEVADLGAGTGKATFVMAHRGWHVTAVEPGEGMLDVLRARAAAEALDVDTRLAGAEDTGLPDASVDLVTAGQAFHWFNKLRAVPEMARITRRSGGAAVFWNARADDRSDFLAAYTQVMERYIPDEHVDRRTHDAAQTTATALGVGGYFDVDDRVELQHDASMSAEAFVGYVFTASYTRLFVDAGAQQRLRAELEALVHDHFGNQPVVVPYDVDVYVGKRTDKQVQEADSEGTLEGSPSGDSVGSVGPDAAGADAGEPLGPVLGAADD